jgi:hypothetical protein
MMRARGRETLAIAGLALGACAGGDRTGDTARATPNVAVEHDAGRSGGDTLRAFSRRSGRPAVSPRNNPARRMPQLLVPDVRQRYRHLTMAAADSTTHPPIRVPAGTTVTFVAKFPYDSTVISLVLQGATGDTPLWALWGQWGGIATFEWTNRSSADAIVEAYARRGSQESDDTALRSGALDAPGLAARVWGFSDAATAGLLMLVAPDQPLAPAGDPRRYPGMLVQADAELRVDGVFLGGQAQLEFALTAGETRAELIRKTVAGSRGTVQFDHFENTAGEPAVIWYKPTRRDASGRERGDAYVPAIAVADLVLGGVGSLVGPAGRTAALHTAFFVTFNPAERP